jgi:hypothetical protein
VTRSRSVGSRYARGRRDPNGNLSSNPIRPDGRSRFAGREGLARLGDEDTREDDDDDDAR